MTRSRPAPPFRAEEVSFTLWWKEGIRSDACSRLEASRRRGRDAAGPFLLLSVLYRWGEERIHLRAKDYGDGLMLWLENSLGRGFSHRTAEFRLPAPDAKRILCFHNSFEGQKVFPTSPKELRFMLRMVLSNLSYALRRPGSFRRYLSSHSKEPTNFGAWSYPRFLSSWRELPPHSFLALAEGDPPLVILAPAAFGQRCRLRWEEGLRCEAWGFDSTKPYPRIPGPILAWGKPYHSLRRVFEILSTVKPWIRRRGRENPLKGLGWCSWNAFYDSLNPARILEGARRLLEGIRLGFVIIDDGWGRYRSRMLSSLDSRFDLAELVDQLKKLGVKQVGVWHALQGYWMGADCERELTLRGTDGRRLPRPEFFEKWYRRMEEWGVDFVKVDNQYDLVSSFLDRLPVEEAAELMLDSVYLAAKGRFSTVLNCMALTPECFVNFRTPLCRASFDYPPDVKELQKKQLLACFYNTLWLSAICVPDFDMFESSGRFALTHAMARVLSGGPVYITDEPEKVNVQLLRRMCLDDGSVAGVDFPALVHEECLFEDPYSRPVPLKVWSRVGEVGVVGVFNLNRQGRRERVRVEAGDAGIKGECVLYAVERREVGRRLEFELGELEGEIVVASPLRGGLALIGVEELLIPPAGVSGESLRKTGTLLVYSESGGRARILGRTFHLVRGINPIPTKTRDRGTSGLG
ncbi:MAG: Sip1-related alpha-galactosidase [Candidatus Hadarchaeales archaeon]